MENQIYDQEIIDHTTIPLTISNKRNLEINENTITKIFGGSSWNAGGNTDQYIPYHGFVSYKVLANTNVMLGLTTYNESPGRDIKYALYAKED